jgi:hypothetical protein
MPKFYIYRQYNAVVVEVSEIEANSMTEAQYCSEREDGNFLGFSVNNLVAGPEFSQVYSVEYGLPVAFFVPDKTVVRFFEPDQNRKEIPEDWLTREALDAEGGYQFLVGV